VIITNIFVKKFSTRLNELIKVLGFSSANDFAVRGLGYPNSEKIQRLLRPAADADKDPKPSFEILNDIANKFVNVNIKWLITGLGELEVRDSGMATVTAEPPAFYGKRVPATPYYNIDVFATHATSFADEKEHITGYITLPGLPACDCAIPVYGNSMEPLINNGDVILCTELKDKTQIHYGTVYLVITDELRVVKYIKKSKVKNHIELWSLNRHHQPFSIETKKLITLYSVKAIVKKIGM
jgi:phage repressor protein C with HTH and peptisase S24 domain